MGSDTKELRQAVRKKFRSLILRTGALHEDIASFDRIYAHAVVAQRRG